MPKPVYSMVGICMYCMKALVYTPGSNLELDINYIGFFKDLKQQSQVTMGCVHNTIPQSFKN